MRVSANGGTPESLVKASLADIAKEGFPVIPSNAPRWKNLAVYKRNRCGVH